MASVAFHVAFNVVRSQTYSAVVLCCVIINKPSFKKQHVLSSQKEGQLLS